MMGFPIDADPRNRDWPKRTWDLDARGVPELRRLLREQGMTVEQFKALPIYTLNIDRLPWLRDL